MRVARRGVRDMANEQPPTRWPSWLSSNFNVPTLIAIGSIILAGANMASDFRSRQETDERERAVMQAQMRAVEQRMQTYTDQNVPYRLTVVEQDVKAANSRIDRLAESVLASIDGLRKEVNGLSTRIEVLTQRVDQITPRKATDDANSAVIRRASAP